MVFETKINFTIIRNLVDSSQSLQDAGKDDKAKEILKDLAKNILEQCNGNS